MKQILPNIVLVSFLQSCGGNADFGSRTNTSSSPRPNGDGTGYKGQAVGLLTWFWQCESDPITAPTPNGGQIVISGQGEHRFLSKSFSATPLIFSGKICPPKRYPRDIVFVIDVSGSMGGSNGKDPVTGTGANATCGRLQAIQTIVNDINSQGTSARFGLVTFSTNVAGKTSVLFADSVNMFADITKGNTPASVLCAANGDTNYGAGLQAAQNLLETGRPEAIREIYFVSDGEPTDSDGPVIADRIRRGITVGSGSLSKPATIATVMLGNGNDTVLKNSIASRDAHGEILHMGSVQASDLAKTLSKLAANEMIESSMQYRAIGSDPWNKISVMEHMKDYSFSLPSIKLDRGMAPNGLEVVFEYKDQHNNVYKNQGQIKWTD